MKIYTAKNIQKWDAYTIKNEPISSIDLMERAARIFTFNTLGNIHFNEATIFCGPGNNGGDGLAVARILSIQKKNIKVVLVGDPKSEDAKTNLKKLPSTVSVSKFPEIPKFNEHHIIIDAIFGSGLDRVPEGQFLEAITHINGINVPVVSIDIPSGFFADSITQKNQDAIVHADLTISFEIPKIGFLFPESDQYTGKLITPSIGLSPDFEEKSWGELITDSSINLKERNNFSHKGSHGKALLIGGFEEMSGAIILASIGCLNTGAGYTFVHTDKLAKTPLLTHTPEVILTDEINNSYSAIGIGMGLGKSNKALAHLEKVLNMNLPMVLDADALNIISEKNWHNHIPKNSILTPHKKELIRLLKLDKASNEFLFKAQQEFSLKHAVFIIQKGKFSKLTTPDGSVFINTSGNPGMASAGMGDVLTGIVTSLLAQGYSPENAAKYGMYLHGKSADEIKHNRGERGMRALEIANNIPQILTKF